MIWEYLWDGEQQLYIVGGKGQSWMTQMLSMCVYNVFFITDQIIISNTVYCYIASLLFLTINLRALGQKFCISDLCPEPQFVSSIQCKHLLFTKTYITCVKSYSISDLKFLRNYIIIYAKAVKGFAILKFNNVKPKNYIST